MKLRYPLRLLVALTAGAIVLAACGGDDSSSSSKNTSASSASPTSAAATTGSFTVAVRKTNLGDDTLVNTDGRTLYAFKVDKGGKSSCNQGCDSTWPPLTVSSATAIKLQKGLDEDDFKTIKRDDGSIQVTDYGQPLYTYSGDTKPGDTNGNGIGNVWYAVNKEGKPVSTGAAPATTTTTGY
jgi:predicted lipoprotein with Yx(FWY)xxD motif